MSYEIKRIIGTEWCASSEILIPRYLLVIQTLAGLEPAADLIAGQKDCTPLHHRRRLIERRIHSSLQPQ